MPKVTYPRPCPTSGKELRRGHFFHHKKQCGTTDKRYRCPLCPLSFSQNFTLQRHVQQQHSDHPPRFFCSECGKGFARKHRLKVHMETVCAEVKSRYHCWYCHASFTRHDNRQHHMRRVHGRVCREQESNLLLHLQHLSEEKNCQNEWMFVESRPIDIDEHPICLCGPKNIHHYFFLENKFNGNRTFVGSTCIARIDPRVGKIITYFHHLLRHPIQGTYIREDHNGLQLFTVQSNTKLVRGADTIIQQLNPQVFCTANGKHYVLVRYPQPETLVQGQSYELCLKANYVRGQLTFTAVWTLFFMSLAFYLVK